MRIICFKHVPFEGPAAFADWAESRGHELKCVEVYSDGMLPAVDNYDCLLVMGGPMNIYEEEKYPWLVAEKTAIRKAIDAGKFVIGVCLGGQLIADQLGGPVTRGETLEIGWFPVTRTPECPKEFPLSESLQAYHWHGDTIALPDGAVRLIGSSACANQAFLYQSRVLGFQCHLETTEASMEALVSACGQEIKEGPFVQDAERMRSEPKATYRNMHAALFAILDHLTRNA